MLNNRLKVASFFTVAVFFAFAGASAAETLVNAGVERFSWRELDTGGSKLLEETGQRLFVGADGVQEGESGLLLGFNARIYGNNVDYDGQTQSIDPSQAGGVSVKTTSQYFGYAVEFNPRVRTHPGFAAGHSLDYVLAIGYDTWVRNLKDSSDANGNGVSGFKEEYEVLFVRLGMELRPEDRTKGWYGGAGIKKPIFTYEKVNLTSVGFSSNPVLRPGTDFSFYASAGYRYEGKWDFSLYYDSYTFKKSDDVTVISGSTAFAVHQPKSLQYTIGFKVGYLMDFTNPFGGKTGGE